LINLENLQIGSHHSAMAAAVAAASLHPDQDTDPRELEAFAERFKQRRIKLGKYNLKKKKLK
jgi:Pou domain - N-terminal to homeobox domain